MVYLTQFLKAFPRALLLLYGVKLISSVQISEEDYIVRSTGYSEVFLEHNLTTPVMFFQWFLSDQSLGTCYPNFKVQISKSFKYVNISCFNESFGFIAKLSIWNLTNDFNNKTVKLVNDEQPVGSINLTVKDCPTFWDNGVTIANYTGFWYNDTGNFECNHPKQLLHKTNVSFNTATKCTKNALWENQKHFICVAAYLVGSNGPYPAESTLKFNCNLDGSNFSALPTFYLNGNQWDINNIVTWKENGANFSCGYELHNQKVWSNNTILNVTYGPTWNKKDFSCYENKSCVFTVYFNPTADSINLTQTEGGNMFENYTSEIQNQSNSYKFNKSLSMGSYVLSVTNKVNTTKFKFKVVNSANLSDQSYLGLILGIGIPLAVIFTAILVYVCYKRKGKPKKSKKENSQSQMAMSSDVANNVVAKNGTNMQTTNEKEDRVNPLYAASGSHPDSLEDAYAQVDKHKKSEKEDKINPLYGATGQETLGENSETYASVNKLNKKKKKKADKGSKEKEVRVNPIYASSSTAIPETNEATYAVVDKKSKSKSEKVDRVNPLYGTTGKETVAKENTETYSTVNKIKKK